MMDVRMQLLGKGIAHLRNVPKHEIKEIIEYTPNIGVIVYKDLYDLDGERYDFTNAQEMDIQGNFNRVDIYRNIVIRSYEGDVIHYLLLVCYEKYAWDEVE